MLRSSRIFIKEYLQEIEARGVRFQQRPNSILLENSDQIEIAFVDAAYAAEFPGRNDRPRLIRIWEDQIQHSPEIIRSRLNSLFGLTERIHARETVVKKIAQPTLTKFLVINHLNIPIKSKIKYGLYHKEELVAVAAFSKACPIDRGGRIYRSHELIRYCSLLNHTVVGGLSKILKHFIAEHNPEDIMTYVDKEWSDGAANVKLGFEVVEQTKPQTFFISNNTNTRYYSMEEARNKEGDDVMPYQIENLGNLKMIKFLV